MKKIILGVAAAVATFAAGAAMAQPYGYGGGYHDDYYGGYGRYERYDRYRYRDSDRDGIPDRREWNRDRDRDGRPDQYDRYDNRRGRHGWNHHHRYDRWDRYDRDRYDRSYDDRYRYRY